MGFRRPPPAPRWTCNDRGVRWNKSYTHSSMQPRIMYIERKSEGLSGAARIGRVSFSKTGKTLYYGGRKFETLGGRGFKSNYFDVENGEEY